MLLLTLAPNALFDVLLVLVVALNGSKSYETTNLPLTYSLTWPDLKPLTIGLPLASTPVLEVVLTLMVDELVESPLVAGNEKLLPGWLLPLILSTQV